MATIVQEVRQNLNKRLEELQAAVDEADEIRSALAALDSNGSSPAPVSRRRGRKGKRADEFVKLVKSNPGIKVSDAARQMGIEPNYLYRVAADLVKKSEIKKDGKGYSVA